MLNLYTKAALCAFKPEVKTIALPREQLVTQLIPDQNLINQYNQIAAWGAGDNLLCLHPLYLQVLSLPMQLQMMVNKSFPFKPIGLVHIANRIIINAMPTVEPEYQIINYFGEVYRHKRGIVFQVITEAKKEKKTMLVAESYYLSRQSSEAIEHYPGLSEFSENQFLKVNSKAICNDSFKKIDTFEFGHDIGRKYAKISRDYNPIHLWPITANLFGFKQAIAHGMLTKALVISAMFNENPEHLDKINGNQKAEIKAVFKAPIMLPNECELRLYSAEDNSACLRLCSNTKKKDRIHLNLKFSLTD